jgi:Zn-dependent protease with chaperone function
MKTSLRTRALAITLCMVTAFPSWMLAAVKTTPELPDPGDVGVSKQEQIQLGQQAVGEVYKQMPVLPDSNEMTQYVNNLGQRLAAVIPQQYNWPYQFHVIPQKEINAFALPGGNIFVNVGTITAAANEAQLAGVIGHEMAHVYMQHSIKQMKKSQGPSILAGLGQILGSMVGGVGGAIASIGGQIAGGALMMKYSRADEAQADAVGAIILYKASYDPRQMAQFFQTLAQESGGRGGPQWLSDHPDPGNRYQAVSNQVKNWPSRSFITNNSRFQQIRSVAGKTRTYTAEEIAQMAKSGQIRNTGAPAGAQQPPATIGNVSRSDVMPSGQFQTLNSQAFTIDYPSNWQPTQDQQSGGVTIAPPAGVTQGAIAYGVVIGAAQPQASSLDDAVNQLVQGMTQQNQGLRQTGSLQSIRVNGLAGRAVDLSGPSPITDGSRQLQEHDWLVALPYGQGGLVYLVFVAPDRDFNQLKGTYNDMLRTFRLNQQQY